MARKSVRRFDASAIPTTRKACGQYINSVRAVQDAMRRGFDEAIFLNQAGEVAEGSGENLFLVRAGGLVTNDADAGVLLETQQINIMADEFEPFLLQAKQRLHRIRNGLGMIKVKHGQSVRRCVG